MRLEREGESKAPDYCPVLEARRILERLERRPAGPPDMRQVADG